MNQYASHSTKERGFTEKLAIFYLCGCILASGWFTYIHIGPIYITEIVLGLLLLDRFEELQNEDQVLIFGIIIFFIAGMFAYGNFSMVGKDLAWLYYPLFLAVFPKSLTDKEYALVKVCFYIKAFYLVFGLLAGSSLFMMPYADGVTIIGFYAYSQMRQKQPHPIWFKALLFFASIGTTFKTATIAAFTIDPLIKYRHVVKQIYRPSYWIPAATIIFILLGTDIALDLMEVTVDLLNVGTSIFGIAMENDYGTSSWRSVIWREALKYWSSNGLWLWGELPGHNFLDPHLLPKLKNFGGITGGEEIGMNRSPHNLFVLIALKTGLIGFALYYWYTYTKIKDRLSSVAPFLLLGILMSLTGNVLETPHSAPIFYSFIALIYHLAKPEPEDNTVKLKSALTSSISPLQNPDSKSPQGGL